jgi:hypothetical protein
MPDDAAMARATTIETTTPAAPPVHIWLTIDEAAGHSKRSRSTIERAMRAERRQPGTGLKHHRRDPDSTDRRGWSSHSRVAIKLADLECWMQGGADRIAS